MCDNGRILEEAAVLHAELNIDFTDAYLACFAREKGLEAVYTFDKKHFSRVPWIHRVPLIFVTLSSTLFVITHSRCSSQISLQL